MESADQHTDSPSGLLMLHLLGRCNLECRHCYMEGSPVRKEYLPLEQVLGAIGECKQLGIGTLCVTGGEPLLYRDIELVLRVARRDAQLQITLCTNGMLITPRLSALLRELSVRLNISVDGDEAFHDQFRNLKGAFRATEKGVRTAVEARIPITIVTTVSQDNLSLLPHTVGWAAKCGATQLLVQPLLKLGRGTNIAEQCLTFTQMNRLILQLSDLANQYRDTGLSCQVIGASRKFLLAHPCGAYVCNGMGCHRGVAKEIKKLVIREDGTVLPEVPNLSHRFALGRIEDGPLTAMVNRYFENGYGEFDRLCRTAYAEVLPEWDCVIVPWEQIIAERSQHWVRQDDRALPAVSCGGCLSAAKYGNSAGVLAGCSME
jgi:Fe-coproporphyrin III synthase